MKNKKALILTLMSTMLLSGCTIPNTVKTVEQATIQETTEKKEESISETKEDEEQNIEEKDNKDKRKENLERNKIRKDISKNETQKETIEETEDILKEQTKDFFTKRKDNETEKEENIEKENNTKTIGSFTYSVPEGFKEGETNDGKVFYYNQEAKSDLTIESLSYEKNQIVDYDLYLENLEKVFTTNNIKFERLDDTLNINNISYKAAIYDITEDNIYDTDGIFYLLYNDKANHIFNIVMFEFLNGADIDKAEEDFYTLINNIYLNDNLSKTNDEINKTEPEILSNNNDTKEKETIKENKGLEIYDGNYMITLDKLPSNFKNNTEEEDDSFYISKDNINVFARISYIDDLSKNEAYDKEFYADTEKYSDFSSKVYTIKLNNKDYEVYEYAYTSLQYGFNYNKYEIQLPIDKENALSIKIDNSTPLNENEIKEIISSFNAKYVG